MSLPRRMPSRRGCDIELKQQGVNVGGCALNIAVALKRLGIDASNALPTGQGVWADIIRNRMAKEGLHSLIDNAEGDNGWCLALVEPDGERTFMSFSGVENQWNADWLAQLNIPPHSLVYLSGYQLAAPCGELLVRWLESLENVTPFIDFGPRIDDIPDHLMARILACHPLVSLNRQEADIAATRFALRRDVKDFGAEWVERFATPVVVAMIKTAHGISTPGLAAAYLLLPPRWWIPLVRATATPAVCWQGWRLAGRWRMR